MKKVSKYCTNCSTCRLICPTKAVHEKVVDGFPIAVIDENKCINCGLCTKSCPNLISYKKNFFVTEKLIRLKNKENILLSTSGGAFAEIARYILSIGGVVYGAAFNKDFTVSHIRITKKDDLHKILKSKYVQSENTSNLQIEKDLKNNKEVLFSGTPCQVAGLKSYLKKEYLNLLTVDLICHGTPSPEIWKSYIKLIEKNNSAKINKIDFRHYNIKNPENNLLIEFVNGSIINEPLYNNLYGRAFLINSTLNNSCYNCNFKNFKNQSDFTLGDAWGYDNKKYDKISLALINTSKGLDIYEKIKEKFQIFNDYDFRDMLLGNYPILHPPLKSKERNYIFNNLNKYNINKLLNPSMTIDDLLEHDKNNIGILNFHYENYNFGANLVSYSISKIIEQMGYKPYIINFDPTSEINSLEQFRTFEFIKFRQNHLNLTPKLDSSQELILLNKYFDNFIVGSDQVWRKTITQNNLQKYFFDFVNYDKNIISYGASFGTKEFEGNEEEVLESKYLLNKFNAISVRELDGVDICKKTFDKKATLVLDPTLLLSINDYDKLINAEKQESDYIAYYCLFDQDPEFLTKMSALFPNKKLVNIKGDNETLNITNDSIFVYNSIGTWLNGIKNCDYVVTDSYHGVLFSILYNKEFICLGETSVSKSRFDNIAEILSGGINDRIFKSLNDINNVNDLSQLNYKSINKNIEKYKTISFDYLKESLNKTKRHTQKELLEIINHLENSNNIVKNKNSELLQNYKELNEQSKDLSNRCNALELDNIKLNQLLKIADLRIHNIILSKSWRLTAPLRYTASTIQKLKNK